MWGCSPHIYQSLLLEGNLPRVLNRGQRITILAAGAKLGTLVDSALRAPAVFTLRQWKKKNVGLFRCGS
jgi:hypothetical protein